MFNEQVGVYSKGQILILHSKKEDEEFHLLGDTEILTSKCTADNFWLASLFEEGKIQYLGKLNK